MLRALTSLLVLASALTVTLAPGARSGPAVPPGPGAVISMHVQLFRAIDAGDAERAAAFVGPDLEATLLLDRARAGEHERELEPVLDRGRTAVAERLAEWARASKDLGYSTSIEAVRADCSSGELSYAVLEIERSRATATGKEVERYLSTSLVHHRSGGWRLMHWHLSPAGAPEVARK
jgi:hypothetical protein